MNSMKTDQAQWNGYDTFKASESRVEEYYDAVHRCQDLALKQLLHCGNESLAIDVACGYGDSTRRLKPYAASIVGVDSSKHLIDQARERSGDDPTMSFECCTFDELQASPQSFGLLNASWFLNHLHCESSLLAAAVKIAQIVKPGGAVCLITPGASFTSVRTQSMALRLGWEQAWFDFRAEFTRGVFRYDQEWIRTTIWQPMTIMRLFRPWMDLRCWDVKSTLISEDRLPWLKSEPPFEVLYGTVLSGAVES